MDSMMDWKLETQKQWNANPCGMSGTHEVHKNYSLEFFDSIRAARYMGDPWMKQKIPFSSGMGKKVLEIGFGMGSDLLTWCEHGAECYGIDITQEHYRLAKLNFEFHHKTAHLQLADASDIPFPAKTFDIVYSHGVLHHTPDTVRCISEAYRVLRPGGQMIISMYRTYSACHIVRKLIAQGIFRGDLKRLGYKGLMATIERGADGITIKPLVKLYTKAKLKHMLADFAKVEFKVAHFERDHLTKLGRIIPRFFEKHLERWLGWYLIAYAVK